MENEQVPFHSFTPELACRSQGTYKQARDKHFNKQLASKYANKQVTITTITSHNNRNISISIKYTVKLLKIINKNMNYFTWNTSGSKLGT